MDFCNWFPVKNYELSNKNKYIIFATQCTLTSTEIRVMQDVSSVAAYRFPQGQRVEDPSSAYRRRSGFPLGTGDRGDKRSRVVMCGRAEDP